MAFIVLALLFSLNSLSSDITINIANGEWPPYQSKSLEDYGVLSKVIVKAFENENIKVKFQFLPWKRGYISTKGTQIDATFVWSKNATRQAEMIFSDEVYTVQDVFFYNSSKSELVYKDMSSLRGYNVGVTNGYDYGNKFNIAAQNKVFQQSITNTDLSNLKKLGTGRIDAFPCAKLVCSYIMQRQVPRDLKKNIAFTKKAYKRTPMFLIISKQHKSGPFIIKKFNSGLKKLKKSGEYKKIIDKFLNKT